MPTARATSEAARPRASRCSSSVRGVVRSSAGAHHRAAARAGSSARLGTAWPRSHAATVSGRTGRPYDTCMVWAMWAQVRPSWERRRRIAAASKGSGATRPTLGTVPACPPSYGPPNPRPPSRTNPRPGGAAPRGAGNCVLRPQGQVVRTDRKWPGPRAGRATDVACRAVLPQTLRPGVPPSAWKTERRPRARGEAGQASRRSQTVARGGSVTLTLWPRPCQGTASP